MKFSRSAGVLLHITSLPGGGWVGDIGDPAYRFIDFLAEAGQRVWQILPLSPPAQGNSPYSAYSAFAGNPLMISLSKLVDDGLLTDADLVQCPAPVSDGAVAASDLEPAGLASPRHCDFLAAAAHKEAALSLAFERLQNTASHRLRAPLLAFCKNHATWLNEFSRFEAIMRHLGDANWSHWPAELITRQADALARWDDELAEAIDYSKFKQFVFDRQWHALKQYAGEHNVQICGDMPIFIAHESVDVWAHQSLFAVDEAGRPTLVAGVPPDYFSETGQLWGNPQYNWEALEKTHYQWWIERFAEAMRQFDLLRVDHFRGFEAYWAVPATAPTAESGAWVRGPGVKLFDAAREALGELPFIAEDLGLITEEVHQLRQEVGLPGMRVLQFGFDQADDDFHRPNTYPEDSVAYTGTHDNDTLVGWLKQRLAGAPDRLDGAPDPLDQWIETHPHPPGEPVYWQLIDAVLQSPSRIAIIPMQDLLGLDNSARMNIPGQAAGNWTWRMSDEAINNALASKLKELTLRAGR